MTKFRWLMVAGTGATATPAGPPVGSMRMGGMLASPLRRADRFAIVRAGGSLSGVVGASLI